MSNSLCIAVIGCGTMGSAVAEGLIRSGMRQEQLSLTVRSEASAAAARERLGLPVGTDNEAAVASAEVIIVAVKPHKARAVFRNAAACLGERRPLVISLAAGLSTADILSALGDDSWPVVRAMPNTPCLVGKGMVVLSPSPATGAEHVARARSFFSELGRVRVLGEEHMDAVTGLSGSGPAFVYLIIEALSEGGVMVGLPRQVATELAAQTVAGAADMVLQTGRHPAALKDDVTTPAGCTISALLTLEDGSLRSVLARGVQEATRAAAGLGE